MNCPSASKSQQLKGLEENLLIELSKLCGLKHVSSVFLLNFEDDEMYKAPRSIFIEIVTKSTLSRLSNDGSVSGKEYKFYLAAHNYFKVALIYIKKKLPLNTSQ